ncbi:MAG: N-formylglutamate amidohydrolase [bacterium]|nr:N-formylglutamate amidohydrolase [bacterium]
MTEKLPVLISIPHGGTTIPDEVLDRVVVEYKDMFYNGDTLTRELFNYRDSVEAFVDTEIAKAIIDVNKAPHDRPPEHIDGVFKKVMTNGSPIYKLSSYPDDTLIETMLDKYYYPYHRELDRLQALRGVKIGLDCHTMLAEAPEISSQAGQERPLICLSNRGDYKGEPISERGPVTSTPEVLRCLADSFKRVFDITDSQVFMNHPVYGGYIIQSHYNGSIPWIQVEINRKLYLLSDPFEDEESVLTEKKIIRELHSLILDVFKDFAARVSL